MFFLAIVTKPNLLAGKIIPCYILCQGHGDSPNRSGWRVRNVTSGNICTMPKVLVHEMNGHDEMLDFLSYFRTRDHMHGDEKYSHEDTKKYYPEGALFWFECNKYGERSGPAYFVRNVPYKKYRQKTDKAFETLKEIREAPLDFKNILLDEQLMYPYGEYVFVPLPDARWSRRHPIRRRKRSCGSDESAASSQ